MSGCLQAEAGWPMSNAPRSKSHRGREAGRDDGTSLPTQRSYGSRIFPCHYPQLKTIILPSQVNAGMRCNVSLIWPCCLELQRGVWFGDGRGVCVKGGVGGEEQTPGPWAAAAAPLKRWWASRPGKAGCKVAISHGFRVAFHLWSWFQRALLKL